MKKNILSITLLGAALSFHGVNAQVAAKKDVTLEEIFKHLNTLVAANDDNSKAELEKEAKALAESRNEDFVSLAARVYETLNQSDEAEKIKASLVEKFPTGVNARGLAYSKIFNNETITASEAEAQYNAWLKNFPENSFEEKDKVIYGQAVTRLAQLYYSEGNALKANEYVDQLKTRSDFPRHAYSIANDLLKENDSKNALPILEEAYNQLQVEPSAESDKRPVIPKRVIVSLYAQALHSEGNTDKTVALLEELLNDPSAGTFTPENTVLLAQGYTKQGKESDAFSLLEKSLVDNGINESLIKEIEPLYNKLNQNNSNGFATYVSSLKTQAKEALAAKYTGEMIKKEAPNFSLVNRNGDTVSLADLKGKVVVLDFWATWCGPCKISFPGMQAAVNKYQDDNEVEFLFIDTWQREENYKEVVEQFITENNYTFHVLFDEMKDRSKATTTAYGVRGIPHKVVIDKEGFIRFESSGGSADIEKIVSEMETKIELARKG